MNTHISSQVVPAGGAAPRVMLRRSAGEMTFDARLPVELVARLKDPAEILKDYGYAGQDAFNLVVSPAFQTELKRCIEENEQGLTFRRRAQLMAPDVLEHVYDIATDKNVAATTRLAAAQWIGRMADVEPKDKGGGENNAFQLFINLG